jgi:hypothetical protein
MIDINEVLRRAFEAGKMPPKPEAGYRAMRWNADGSVSGSYAVFEFFRRPDGVWEMPE